MSFIYNDKKLLANLLKSAQQPAQTQSQPTQQGMIADPSVNMEFKNYLTLSQKMVQDLLNKYNPSEKDPSEVTADKSAQMTVSDMNTLGNFFEFIAKNKISIGGNRVVLYPNEDRPNNIDYLPVDAVKRSVVGLESKDLEGNRNPITSDYYVNKELIQKYFNTLTERANREKDPQSQRFIKVLLGSLGSQINSLLKTNLSSDYKAPELQLKLDDFITDFPDVLDPKNYNLGGTKKLYWGNIQSADNLKNWIINNGISVKTPQNTDNSSNKEVDHCAVIQTIYGKVTSLQRSYPDPTGKYKKIIEQIVRISSSFNGPDGKPCNIAGGANQSANQSANQGTNKVKFEEIIDNLPFVRGMIDLDRIESFLNIMSQEMGNDPTTFQDISKVRGAIDKFKVISDQKQFNLGINTGQFSALLNGNTPQERAKKIYPALDALNEIINLTRPIVDRFYIKNPRMTGDYRSAVLAQIGRNESDFSLYNSNAESLQKLYGTPYLK